MKTKEEIYLEVNTPKKADKLKKVLKMFNQPVYSKHSIDNCVNSACDLVIHYDGEEFLNASLSEEELEDKTKVKIKELKNILAVENLKEGDVIILEGGEEKYKWVVEVNRAEESENFPICVHPKNYVGLDGVEKYDEDTTAISGKFVRFATKAEKELMNGQKVAAPTEPLVKIGNWYWFKNPAFEKRALVYVNDISESCNGNFGFNYEHEWMTGKGYDSFGAHYALEDGCLYEETTITKATDEEVEAMLIEEAERRGFKIGCKFLGCLGADSVRQLELNKFELGHKGGKIRGLFCGNSWITFNGEWGKVVEEDEPKVGDIVEVVMCGEPYAFITVIQKIHKSPHEHEENPYFVNGWRVEGKPRILKTDSEIIEALNPF